VSKLIIREIVRVQGRPINVKHGARCAMGMGNVGKRQKPQRGIILMYYYKFAVIG